MARVRSDMESAKVSSTIRKVKNKQVKDELDRIKQAEKKKRRLEKALATSAAICSELEKKKLKKQKEQQRLDEEGAAIAEAVALQVLLGEDLDDTCNIMKDEGFQPWDCPSKFDLFIGGRETYLHNQDISRHLPEETKRVSNAHIYGYTLNDCGDKWTILSGTYGRDFYMPYSNDQICETTNISAIGAQAISSLQIARDENADTFMFNQMLRG